MASATAAAAAPTSSLLNALRGAPPNFSAYDDRPFLVEPDGTILAIADSAHYVVKSKFYSEVDKRLSLRIVRVGSNGKLDRSFAQSRIGRGLSFGHAKEFWRFNNLVQVDPNTVMATGFTDSQDAHRRSVRVMFDANTGALKPDFAAGRPELQTAGTLVVNHFYWPQSGASTIQGTAADCGELQGATASPAYVRFARSSGGVAPAQVLLDPSESYRERICQSIANVGDGRILASGVEQAISGRAPTVWVARIGAEGVLDSSFGTSGSTTLVPSVAHDPSVTRAKVSSLLPTPDGGAVIIGSIGLFGKNSFVAKVTSAGAMDTTFGSNGWLEFKRMEALSGLLAPDGSVLIGGGWRKSANRGFQPAVGRLLPDGSWDKSFGTNGIWSISDLRGPFTELTRAGDTVLAGMVIQKSDVGRVVPARVVRLAGLFG